eukprot:gene296-317_t
MGYPWKPEYKKAEPNVDCSQSAFPQPMSYHIHVTYKLTNQKEIADVSAFRDEAIAYFAPYLGDSPVCQGTDSDPSGRYDNGRLCAIYDHDITNTTLGPFAVGEWSFFVPVHYLNALVPWFVSHRANFTLLVHPNTGCENEDHSIWARWVGPPWNMDMSIFTPYTQTESFGQSLGTPENPTCLTRGGVCSFGQAKTYGPQVVCCAGSACICKTKDDNCYCD